jgi:hypothetical protein
MAKDLQKSSMLLEMCIDDQEHQINWIVVQQVWGDELVIHSTDIY